MPPRKVLIIRHAEKPDKNGSPPAGVRADGSEDDQSLSVQGWQRAGALCGYFSEWNARLEALGLAVPEVIFGSDDHKRIDADGGKLGSKSRRPRQTVTPLAARLGLDIDRRFSEGEEAGLFAAVMACDGVVLISWQHEKIPAVANMFVPLPNPVPQAWPEDRYDVVWVFDPPARWDGAWQFRQVPQRLLAGDRDEPIASA